VTHDRVGVGLGHARVLGASSTWFYPLTGSRDSQQIGFLPSLMAIEDYDR
jgi:hypothetical protein